MSAQQNKPSTKRVILINAAILGYLGSIIFMLFYFMNAPSFYSIAAGSGELMPGIAYLFVAILCSVLSAICWKYGTKEPLINDNNS